MFLGAIWHKKGSAGVGEMDYNIQVREGYIRIYVQTFHGSMFLKRPYGVE
jgi:hypothetical protein